MMFLLSMITNGGPFFQLHSPQGSLSMLADVSLRNPGKGFSWAWFPTARIQDPSIVNNANKDCMTKWTVDVKEVNDIVCGLFFSGQLKDAVEIALTLKRF